MYVFKLQGIVVVGTHGCADTDVCSRFYFHNPPKDPRARKVVVVEEVVDEEEDDDVSECETLKEKKKE